MRQVIVDSHAKEVGLPAAPRVIVVDNPALRSLLLNRSLIGWPFRQACLAASTNMILHVADELHDKDVAELVVLSKGLVYSLAQAYGEALSENLPVNVIATQRAAVTSEMARISIPYQRLDAGGSVLLVGDTVASGSTICAALDAYRSQHTVTGLYVFSYAAARQGLQRISRYCTGAGIALTFVVGLAIFDLADNGFDLPLCGSETRTDDEVADLAADYYGGLSISAVGWDFGTQCMAPTKYRNLMWIEAEAWGEQGNSVFELAVEPTDWSMVGLEADAYRHQLPHLPVVRPETP